MAAIRTMTTTCLSLSSMRTSVASSLIAILCVSDSIIRIRRRSLYQNRVCNLSVHLEFKERGKGRQGGVSVYEGSMEEEGGGRDRRTLKADAVKKEEEKEREGGRGGEEEAQDKGRKEEEETKGGREAMAEQAEAVCPP
jgi:hypothetical protein